jgi:hypothetical protein
MLHLLYIKMKVIFFILLTVYFNLVYNFLFKDKVRYPINKKIIYDQKYFWDLKHNIQDQNLSTKNVEIIIDNAGREEKIYIWEHVCDSLNEQFPLDFEDDMKILNPTPPQFVKFLQTEDIYTIVTFKQPKPDKWFAKQTMDYPINMIKFIKFDFSPEEGMRITDTKNIDQFLKLELVVYEEDTYFYHRCVLQLKYDEALLVYKIVQDIEEMVFTQ